MPNVKLFCEADVATRTDTAIAAGAGLHLPIGQWSSADYRSAMRFPLPNWNGWTSITKATITVFMSDAQHVGPSAGSLFVSRMNTSSVWTKGEGSQSCESGFTAGNTTQFDDIASTATDRVSFTGSATANASKTMDVTAAMRYYWAGRAYKPVFVFDNNGSGEYGELWSRNKGGAYVAYISIDYVDASVPNPPTLTSPTSGATVPELRPSFAWVHSDVQGDPQLDAQVNIWDAAGTTLITSTHPSPLTAMTAVSPIDLVRGTTYQWSVQTQDVTGWGNFSGKIPFTVKAAPTVVIDTTRYMVFNGAPRLQVRWTVSGGNQVRYRVTAGAYDSTLLPSVATSHTLDTLALTNGTAVPITVYIETDDPVTPVMFASATYSFTPRWGLTTHRRDLGAVLPLAWGSPTAIATVPQDASLVFEYASAPPGGSPPPAAPANAWTSQLSTVPLLQYLFWRAWFIPSAVASPVLDYLNIPTDNTASFVDKWGTIKDVPGLTGVWSISNDEFVYGSRSLQAKVTGAGPFYAYAFKVLLKKDRAYIVTGLMQSTNNSGACIELQDVGDPAHPELPGTVLLGGGVEFPVGSPMRTKVLTATTKWFTPDGRDVNRYKTPVYTADIDREVYVVLKVGGDPGSIAWFDAIKLEESTVATPWSPGAVGATVVDAGGVQVDANRGGIFRLRGTDGAPRSIVESGAQGLKFGLDTELSSPSTGVLAVGGVPIPLTTYTPPVVAGTAFPTVGLVAGQRFWRIDKNMEFYWSGTIWLSTTLFKEQMTLLAANPFTASAGASQFLMFDLLGGSDLWLDHMTTLFFVNAGTALSASHSWVSNSYKVDAAGGLSNIASVFVNSGAVSLWRQTVNVLGQLLGPTYIGLRVDWTKTGTPGNFSVLSTVYYRIVAT